MRPSSVIGPAAAVGVGFCLSSPAAHAGDGPVTVTGAYGLTVGFTSVSRVDDTGSETLYQPSFPNFQFLAGVGFDRANERVLINGVFTTTNRLLELDEDLEPGTVSVVRDNGTGPTGAVDVDQTNGRVYWWQNGEILSVASDGTGVPVLEAKLNASPVDIEIDAERGVYFALLAPGDQFATGPLDGSDATTFFDTLKNSSIISGLIDIAIDPLSGDFVWTENGLVGGTDLSALIVRTPNDLSDIRVVRSVESPPLGGSVVIMSGVDVFGDQVLVSEEFGSAFATEFRLRVYDLTEGTATDFATGLSGQVFSLDMDVEVDPIFTQPESALVEAGQPLSASVTSLDPNAAFRWFRGGQALADDGRITGAGTGTLAIASAELGDTDLYRCRVTVPGGQQQFSDEAVLAVRQGAEPPCLVDFNNDGQINILDIVNFVTEWNAGCP